MRARIDVPDFPNTCTFTSVFPAAIRFLDAAMPPFTSIQSWLPYRKSTGILSGATRLTIGTRAKAPGASRSATEVSTARKQTRTAVFAAAAVHKDTVAVGVK